MNSTKRVYLSSYDDASTNKARATYDLDSADITCLPSQEISVGVVEAVLPTSISWLAPTTGPVLEVATAQSGYVKAFLYITDGETVIPAYTGNPTETYMPFTAMTSATELIAVMNIMLQSVVNGALTARWGVDNQSGKLISEDGGGSGDQLIVSMKYGNPQGGPQSGQPEPAYTKQGQLILQALGLNTVNFVGEFTSVSGFADNNANRAIWHPVCTPRIPINIHVSFGCGAVSSAGVGESRILESILQVPAFVTRNTLYKRETSGGDTDDLTRQDNVSNIVFTKKHVDRVRVPVQHVSDITIELKDAYGTPLFSIAPPYYELEFEVHDSV